MKRQRIRITKTILKKNKVQVTKVIKTDHMVSADKYIDQKEHAEIQQHIDAQMCFDQIIKAIQLRKYNLSTNCYQRMGIKKDERKKGKKKEREK